MKLNCGCLVNQAGKIYPEKDCEKHSYLLKPSADLSKRIFNNDARDKTRIVVECEKCHKLANVEREWLRFIRKIGDLLKCVDCLFPNWNNLRSPLRQEIKS